MKMLIKPAVYNNKIMLNLYKFKYHTVIAAHKPEDAQIIAETMCGDGLMVDTLEEINEIEDIPPEWEDTHCPVISANDIDDVDYSVESIEGILIKNQFKTDYTLDERVKDLENKIEDLTKELKRLNNYAKTN
jgi:hypothetical protein